MASRVIHRVTLFKVPDAANVQPILEKYSTLAQEAKKDGKPYILSCKAGKAVEDQRNQGYSLAAETTFKNLEDMRFYDEECSAHAELKGVAKGKVGGPPLVVFFEGAAE